MVEKATQIIAMVMTLLTTTRQVCQGSCLFLRVPNLSRGWAVQCTECILRHGYTGQSSVEARYERNHAT